MFKRIFLRKCEKAIQKNINVVEKIHLKDVDVWKDGSNIKVDFNGTLTLSKEDLKKCGIEIFNDLFDSVFSLEEREVI